MYLDLLLAFGIGLGHAAPWQLTRPLHVPGTAMVKRATTSDPSCPQGFICEGDLMSCPTGTICPADTACVNFGGALACAPAVSGLSWCAINPDTYEAVACPDGRCCHGQCYLRDSVCCGNPNTRCTLGTLCNACPRGKTCGPNASCLDTTVSSSDAPSGTVTFPTGISGSISMTSTSSSRPPSQTSTSSTSGSSSGTSSAPEPTGTADFGEVLGLLEDLLERYMALVSESGLIVKQLDVLADPESRNESGLQERQAPSDAAAAVRRIDRFRSTAVELLSGASTVRTRVNAIPEREWIPLTETRNAAISQASELETQTSRLVSSADDILSRNIPSLGPRALQFVRDLAKNTLVRRVAIGLTALNWLAKTISLLRDALDHPGSPGEPGPTISIVIPPTPTTPPIGTPTLDPTVPATPLPDEFIVLMSEETTTAAFGAVIVEILLSGDIVLGYIANAKAKVWDLWVIVRPLTLFSLDINPLVICISRNAQVEMIGTIEGPGRGRMQRTRRRAAAAEVLNSTHGNSTNELLGVGDTNATLDTRAMPQDFMARIVTLNKAEYPRSVPFHLTWMHSIWHKEWLRGQYYEMPDYWVDTEDLRTSSRDIRVYLMDSQVDWKNPELSLLGETLGFPGYDCGTDEFGCDDITGTDNPYPDRRSDGYHGTQMAAMIAGWSSGVNPQAGLMPLRVPASSRLNHLAAAAAQVRILQTNNNNKRSILSFSQQVRLTDLQTSGLNTPWDIFDVLIPNLNGRGVDIVTAAGNDGTSRSQEAYQYTPHRWSGDAGTVIAVGSCDDDSVRDDTSRFVYRQGEPLPNHGFPDIYNIGTDLLMPQLADGSGWGWTVNSGTSASAALTSGLLSLLLARNPTPAGGLTKAMLKNIADNRKGNFYLADSSLPPSQPGEPEIPDPGKVPDTEAYRAPRAATDWELTCEGVALEQQAPTAFRFEPGRRFKLEAQYILNLAEYSARANPRCVLAEPQLNPREGLSQPFPG